jgi:hypothetical protein
METPKGPRLIDCIMAFRANPDNSSQTLIAYYKDRSAEEISYNLPPDEVYALLREKEDAARFIPVTEYDETCYIQIDNIETYERIVSYDGQDRITAIYYHVHESNSHICSCREDITPMHILETPEEIEALIHAALAYRPAKQFVEPKPTTGAFNQNSPGEETPEIADASEPTQTRRAYDTFDI